MRQAKIISCGHIENQLMHPHRNAGMELVLVEKGHLEWAVDNRPEVLTPGSVFFTLPWQAHGSMFICEPKNRIYYILFELARPYAAPCASIRFPQAFGFSSDEEKMLSRLFCGTRQHVWTSSATMRQIFPELIRLIEAPSALNLSAATALLRCLIMDLALSIAEKKRPQTKESAAATRVRRFLERLIGQLDEPWTLDRMAETCGVKRTRFAALCHSISGYPPLIYLGRMRFEKACELLRETARSVTDITYACGYSSTQYFAASFKRKARMSPSDYRKLAPQLEAVLSVGWEYPEWRTREEELQRRLILPSVNGKHG